MTPPERIVGIEETLEECKQEILQNSRIIYITENSPELKEKSKHHRPLFYIEAPFAFIYD